MISTNALSVFLFHHHLNGLINENLRSVQEVMCASEPVADKYKNVCKDFPNLAILTKSSTPEEIQLTFGHAAVGNKSLGESVVACALAGDLSSLPLFPLTSRSPSQPTARRSVSQLRRSCFALLLATLQDQRNSATGLPATLSSSCHF